jgi:hypothetical protein
MKRIVLAIGIIGLFSFGTCKKEKLLPECIQQKIEAIKAQPKWNPPAQVDEYVYQGKRVYLFSADCCDQYTQAFDENCNYICAPSGGITGKGDGRCADFINAA